MSINNNPTPYAHLSKQSLFLVWGPPSHARRSKVFARELGIEALHCIYSTARRGFLAAPFKYSYQAVKTLQVLFQERPQVVFAQSPPSFLVLFVYLYCRLTGAKYLVDVHSIALQHWIWTRPEWLYRFLARKAITTIVTNEHFQEMIQKWGGDAFILRDIPTRFDKCGAYPMHGSFNIVVVNTFAKDEPLYEVLEAAKDLPEIQFYVTGKKKMAAPEALAGAPANVHFTDFLPDEAYYALLDTSQAIMCLTTRNHTMQRGACEALSIGKPIIISDWPLLRAYFHKGTVYVSNTGGGIRQGVLKMKERYHQYQAEIKDLQTAQRLEWQEKIEALTGLVQKSIEVN